ncbi:AraC family transcriptional regulator [Chamaesiphon minutus]|uniref:Transcriptional regulator containing an amidase domain and an AraC-type DNA-binding HTH domain n=1 Tax=Chamaesiphon minutus (strain ATCC 27169 / PCC 6605) TaxID=1173020 RepID=K9UQ89_CHAP6|nr:AraC family transcriptional regulator [Chamaesiphon minutus]AFY96970.1 transcriptional regulator containing an amidase domain and an AraC-type DNA-binding HTH domain [Chamaesiphon minutus PCC 6605]
MPADRPLQIDALHANSLKPLLPKPILLSSHLAGWDNLHLIYHRQFPYSIPETVPTQHTINIYTNPVLAQVKIDGRWQQRFSVGEATPTGMVGDIGIFPARQVAPAAEFQQELGIIHLYLDPVSLSSAAFESIDPDRVELSQQLQIRDPLIQQLGLSLKQELETSAADSRLYAETVATMLAVHLLRRYSVRQPLVQVPTGGLSNYSLKLAIAYINDNLDRHISLAEIAAIVKLSPHYFATLFKQSTGIAPHQYLTQCRIEKAKQYLAKPHLSIVQVSELVGFQSQSHFAKVFRQHVGITPKLYQQSR